MPTAKYFDKCPEFPSDVPVADVPTISHKRLQDKDPEAISELFQAFRQYGFIVLDLNTSAEGRALVQDAEAMFDLTNETLDLDQEVLNQYPIQAPRSLDGYKTHGRVATDDGFKDAMETFMFSQDDVLGNIFPPAPKPHTIEDRLQQCQSFCLRAHDTASVILSCLDSSLGLPTGTLSSLCPLNKTSATGVRMLRSCPAAADKNQVVTAGAHTDIGVITIVFNVVGGLQIRPAESENGAANWKYIRPRQGCAVINVGDTLVEWTGGVFRSNLHRVHDPPGKQAGMVRQSLAYPVRPSRDGSMRRLQGGKVIPALVDGEEDESMSPDEWATWRTHQLAVGNYQPKSIGGIPLQVN